MNENEKKVVTMDAFYGAVDEIRKTYPTQSAVTEQIEAAALGGGITFATEAEVRALFHDTTGEDQGTDTPDENQGTEGTGE